MIMTNTTKRTKTDVNMAGAARLFLAILRSQSADNRTLRAQLERAHRETDELAGLLAKEWGIAK